MTNKDQQKESVHVVTFELGQRQRNITAGHTHSDNGTLNSVKERSKERIIREIVEESSKRKNAQKSTTITKKLYVGIKCGEEDNDKSHSSMSDSDDSFADKTWKQSKDDVCYNSDSSENEFGYAAKKKQKYDTNTKTDRGVIDEHTPDVPLPNNELEEAFRDIVDHE